MNSSAFSLFTPNYNDLTGLLKHLNIEELKDILNNDEKSEDMIKDLKQVKDIEAERDILLASNRSISEYNLSRKDIIQEHKQQLEETHRQAVELKTKLIKFKQEIEEKSGVHSTDTLLALLQAASSEIDEEAESTVDVFLKGEIIVEDFLEKYLELKKLAHLRRIKSEKLARMLQEERNFVDSPPSRPYRQRKAPPPPPPASKGFFYQNSDQHTNQNAQIFPVRPAPYPPPPPQQQHNGAKNVPTAYFSNTSSPSFYNGARFPVPPNRYSAPFAYIPPYVQYPITPPQNDFQYK